MTLPIYWEGKPGLSATEENARNRTIREGQVSGGKGVAVSRTGNGSTVAVLDKPERDNGPESVLAFAQGTGSTTIGSRTIIPLASVENTFTGYAEDALVSLASNVLTFKRPGVYLVTYCLTVGYSSPLGTLGATIKEAKVMGLLSTGSADASESQSFTTLSSRLNVTDYVKLPADAEDGIIFYHGTHTAELTSTPDSDEPSDWHGSAVADGIWQVWTWEVYPSSNDLKITGAPILTNMTAKAEYQSSLYAVQTVTGQLMVRVVYDTTSNGLKVARSGSYYDPTLTLRATATFGGEGTIDPVAVATAATVSVLRVCPVRQVVTT